jgi:hypothetical protein
MLAGMTQDEKRKLDVGSAQQYWYLTQVYDCHAYIQYLLNQTVKCEPNLLKEDVI